MLRHLSKPLSSSWQSQLPGVTWAAALIKKPKKTLKEKNCRMRSLCGVWTRNYSWKCRQPHTCAGLRTGPGEVRSPSSLIPGRSHCSKQAGRKAKENCYTGKEVAHKIMYYKIPSYQMPQADKHREMESLVAKDWRLWGREKCGLTVGTVSELRILKPAARGCVTWEYTKSPPNVML